MKNLKLILILSIHLLTYHAYAQVAVYRSFEDFQNGNGEMYEDYIGYSHFKRGVKLLLKKDGKTIKIHCKEIWGLTYKDALFRIDKKYNQPTRVLSIGK